MKELLRSKEKVESGNYKVGSKKFKIDKQKTLFNDALDISKFAKQGKNEIEVELLTGSRNLFGPFHDKRKVESFWVGPSSFSFYGRWDNFKCDDYTSAYSFARAGIFECDGQFRVVVDY